MTAIESNASARRKILESKNYSFGMQPYKPRCCECGNRRCEKCASAGKKNADTIQWVIRNANRLKNDITAVRKKWHEMYKAVYEECHKNHHAAKAANARKDIISDLAKEAKSKVGAWAKSIAGEMKSEIIDATEWYDDSDARSGYIKTDVLDRSKVNISKKPSFVENDGSGSIYIQIPGGVSPDSLKSIKQTRVMRWALVGNVGRRSVLRIKLAGRQGGESVFADVCVNFHRDIPSDCSIKGVRIIARRCGLRIRYSIVFSVERLIDEPLHETPRWAAVKLGWAEDNGQAKAAEVFDYNGEQASVSCDTIADAMAAKEEKRLLSSEIDEILIPRLKQVIIECCKDGWPDWLIRKCKTANRWVSCYRVLDMFKAARDCGFEIPQGREDVRSLVGLVSRRANIERKMANRRKEWCNNFASNLSKKYDAIGVPSTDYAKLKENIGKKEQESHTKHERQRDTMTFVSPGMIRERIKSKFGLKAFIVNACEKRLGDDTLSFVAASTESLSKGQGVLDNVNEVMEKMENRRSKTDAKTAGRKKKKEIS